MDLLAAIKDLIARVEALEAGGVVEVDEPESVSGTGKVGAVPELDEDSGPIEGTLTTHDSPLAEDEADVEGFDFEVEVEVDLDESPEGGFLGGLE